MDRLKSELYFKTADSELELRNCYRLRYQVYCREKRWLSSSLYPKGLEHDEYDSKSVHVMALDEDFKLVGMMRILRKQDYSHLPYESHPGINVSKSNLANTAELSRFIVSTEKERYHVTHGLLRAVYQTSLGLGIDNWIVMLEPSLFRLLGMFKFYLEPVGTPSLYFGAFTMVARCNIPYTEKMWKSKDKEAWVFNRQDSVLMSPEEMVI